MPLLDEDIIPTLRSGQSEAMVELYARYRADFFRWAGRRFNANRQDFEDAWQESVTAFYTQVMAGKLVVLRYDVRIWLFAVGYKNLLKNHRKLKRYLWKDTIDERLLRESPWGDYPENQIQEEKKERLHSAMKTMSDQCREMLVQRYFMEKSIEEIQKDWDLSNVNATSATLSRCLRRLKDLIKITRTAEV